MSPHLALDCKRTGGHFCLSESSILSFLPTDNQTVAKSNTSKESNIWLLRVEETGNGKFHTLNPLSRIMSEKVVRNFPKVLNWMNVRVSEIAKVFSLQRVETSKHIKQAWGCGKVVVSSRPCTPNGTQGGKLCCIKLGNENWSLVDDPNNYDDVAYYKGKFYAVDFKRRTVVFGSGLGLKVKEVVPAAFPYYGGGQFKYLVVSSEGLFLIDKYLEADPERWADDNCEDLYIDAQVHKLNEEGNDWEFVYSLGDEVFFVGDDCTYSVSVQDFPGLKRNCIYFMDEEFVDFGVYRMVDDKCGTLEIV